MLLSLPVLPPPYSSEIPPTLAHWQRRRYRRLLYEADPHCFYCRKPIGWVGSTLDHVIPCSQGGTHVCENLVLCCPVCNQHKRNRTALEWFSHELAACVRLGQAVQQLLTLAVPAGRQEST